MVFLVATSEWGHPTSDSEASAPARVDAAQLSARSQAEPIARLPIDPPSASLPLASDQADSDYTASTADLPQVAEPDAGVPPELSSSDGDAGARTDLAAQATPPSSGTADGTPDEVGPDVAPKDDAVASESDADEDAAPVEIAEPSPPASPAANDASKLASVEPATTEAATPPAAQVAEAAPPPKPAAGPSQPQEAPTQPRGKAPWKAMSLAPADKPSISLSKVPTSRPSANGYRAKVWSALARHKPKAGQRGSATVIFAIGESGALRFVRVGRSSGNTWLDQLALATVRSAAPYPAPPGGAQSFTIRIDFH